MPALEESGNVASWPASKARHQFRTNPEYEGKSTSGFCMRHVQTNLAILPASLADEFEQFCNLNKAPCPLLYKSKPGELSAGNLAQDSDVRYDKFKKCKGLLIVPFLNVHPCKKNELSPEKLLLHLSLSSVSPFIKQLL